MNRFATYKAPYPWLGCIIMLLNLFFASASFGETGAATGYVIVEAQDLYKNNPIVAVVGGRVIRVDDIKTPRLQKQMEEAYESLFHLLVAEVVNRKAQKDESWSIKSLEPDKKEIEEYIKAKALGLNNHPNLKAWVREQIIGEKVRKKTMQTWEEGIASGYIKSYLSPPTPVEISVSVEDARLLEAGDLPYAILEFVDYQCPYCRKIEEVLVRVPEVYDISVFVKHLPDISTSHRHKEMRFQ